VDAVIVHGGDACQRRSGIALTPWNVIHERSWT
jgi:hypothetical protein